MKRSCQYRRRIRKKTRSSNIIHITIRPSSEARSFTTSTKTKISAPDISTASKLPILKDDKNLVYDHHRKIHLTKKYRHRYILLTTLSLSVLIMLIIGIVLSLCLQQPKKIFQKGSAILRWNPSGITVAGIGGYGNGANQFKNPWDIALYGKDIFYVTDRYNHRIQKYTIGSFNGITVAGNAYGISGSSLSNLSEPIGIQVDSDGNIYINDKNNFRVLFWPQNATSGRKIAGDGTSGAGYGQFNYAYGLECDYNNNMLYISDNYNYRIMSYSLNGSFVGSLVAGGNGAGCTNNNQLNLPVAFYIDSFTKSLIISNDGCSNILRWQFGATNWTLITGNRNGAAGYGPAELRAPADVTLDPMGNMYVADRYNHRIQFFPSNQVNGTTIMGVTGVAGSNSTLLQGPTSLKLDNQLNLYVVDQQNNRVMKYSRY